jgi:hypothetical protein
MLLSARQLYPDKLPGARRVCVGPYGPVIKTTQWVIGSFQTPLMYIELPVEPAWPDDVA